MIAVEWKAAAGGRKLDLSEHPDEILSVPVKFGERFTVLEFENISAGGEGGSHLVNLHLLIWK